MRLWLVLLMLVSLTAAPVRAQDTTVGASYTLLSLSYPDQIRHGFGGWLTWRFVDVAVNVFPEDHPVIGRQTQLLAGVRGGLRTDRFGAFARVRPGLVHFSETFFAPEIACIAIFPTPETCLIDPTNVALGLGGTLEVYPTAGSLVRVDFGDTLIRFARSQQDPVWRHNFQFSAGGGFRF